MGGLNATKKKKPHPRNAPSPWRRPDSHRLLTRTRRAGHQGTPTVPRGRSALQGPETGPPCPVLSAPPQGPDGDGTTAPQPGSWGAAWLPHGSQPTGSGGHSSGCSEAGAATGSRKRNLLRSRPGPSTSSVSPQRPAAQPGTLRPRLCGRLCDRGLGPLAPLPCPLGGGVRGSALHAPWEQSSRAEPWAERGAEGQLGAGAVCTPGVLPRTAPGEADPFSQICVILTLT